ncbi:hypothetical protein I4U23_008116 [Adineta vaga]|nr:hypothetical protein I4U23_008116 [Adineta vaga]
MIECDITNLNEFFGTVKQNESFEQPVGFLSRTNFEVVKRYLPKNIKPILFQNKSQLLNAIDNNTILAGVTTGRLAQDLEPRYHVFSSLIVSPQAMLLTPNYDERSTPYGFRNQANNDLFDALNAAIAGMQEADTDETLLSLNNRTDLIRAYTCRQSTQLPVQNRNETSGFLRDILIDKKPLLIGGLGPFDWGTHDGNYNLDPPTGFYPKLLEEIVKQIGKLKGADGNVYGEGISFKRIHYTNESGLFKALLNGTIYATDVYLLVDGSYNGTRETCSNNTQCRTGESCDKEVCTYPTRPRYLHFRTTCTTASRDTKFITKKNNGMIVIPNNTTRETPKTRWIGYVLVFVALFGTMFLILLVLIRRKTNFRIQHTLQGGFGKFARLQEEAEPPMDGIDAFEDHIVQSPRDNNYQFNYELPESFLKAVDSARIKAGYDILPRPLHHHQSTSPSLSSSSSAHDTYKYLQTVSEIFRSTSHDDVPRISTKKIQFRRTPREKISNHFSLHILRLFIFTYMLA